MKLKQKLQRGFTLIELMIVVAIVGILAAIALPTFNEYTARARVTEVILAGTDCKNAISLHYASGGAVPTAINSFGCETTTASGPVGRMVQSMTTDTSSVITLTTTAAVTGTANQGIRLRPCTNGGATGAAGGTCTAPAAGSTNIAVWLCGGTATGATGGTVETKFLPTTCRSI